jgi:O-antigen/teichoic acid export membrane protein
MDNRAILTIIQALIKGTLSPLLVYIGYGISGVVIGHTISYIVAAVTGIFVVFSVTKQLPEKKYITSSPKSLRLLLGYGLPLFLGSILIGLASQFNGFLLSWFIMDELIGNYSVAVWFVSFVSVVSASIVTTFLPTFSKYDVNHERKITEDVYQGSVRYSSIFLIPFICLLITPSEPGISTLFGSKYPHAPLFLSLLMIPHLLVGMGSLSIDQFLNSQRETKATMTIQSVSSIIKIILSLIFIRIWGVTGLILGLITSEPAKNLLGLYVLRKKFGIKPKTGHMIRTLICSGISSGISLSLQILNPLKQQFFNLAINTSIFMISFLLLAPLLGVLERRDIQNLNSMLKNIPLLYPLANIILTFEARLLNM